MPTKHDLKWRAVESALSVASTMGQRERLLNQVVNRITDEHELVDASIREFEYAGASEGMILYPLVQGRSPVRNYMVCALAHAFRVRGYEPLVLLCDASLEMCMKRRHDEHDDARCAVCTHTGRKLFDAFGLDPIYLSDVPVNTGEQFSVDDPEDPFDVEYGGVDLSNFAIGSTRNRLKRNEINLEDAETRMMYEGFLRSGAHLVDATDHLLNQHDVTHVLGNHPAYLYGGVPLAAARERGVQTITIMGGKRDRTLIVGYFDDATPLPTYTDQAYLDEVLERPLKDEQNEELDELIEGRRDGSTVRYHYAGGADESVDADDEALMVGVFSNLMWDASLGSKAITFANPYEWVVQTLSTLTGHESVSVILKPHPAEAMRDSNRRLDHWLQREHPELVNRIDLLPPDTDVSPYEMIADIDIGVVYSTNLALEMAIEGIPAIVAADVHYRGHGFTIDPEGREAYLETLRNIEDIEMTAEMQTRARRYAHLLWVRKHIPYPVYETSSKDDFGSVHALPVDHDDLTPGNKHIDFVIDRVLAGEPVVQPLRGDN
ncbi:hypothetical protein ACFQGE_14720 [Halomicroarcula sp. GCM10025817]|uniref:hypothetical protein n=1 Tax=Haloarcula TaxID=2237 RepID=UPI0023E7BF16|nr:hypothetical protein [Halomicroarcula sp. SYNS111]